MSKYQILEVIPVGSQSGGHDKLVYQDTSNLFIDIEPPITSEAVLAALVSINYVRFTTTLDVLKIDVSNPNIIYVSQRKNGWDMCKLVVVCN